MKDALPEIAIRVFAQMMRRKPTTDEQLALRQLHDAYAGKDTTVACGTLFTSSDLNA